MSLRIFAQRLVQNGRIFIRSLRYNELHYSNQITRGHINKIHVIQVDKPLSQLPQGSNNVTNTLGYIGAQARRLFVNNILNRVTNSLAGDLRRKATNRLLVGDSKPFFALVGVSLASGTGILTKDEELEGVCWEIRDAVSKLQWTKQHNDQNYETDDINDGVLPSLKSFTIGPAIAKGCSAVVYAARLKKLLENENLHDPNIAANTEPLSAFPLALKMMFNYDAESNALTILKAMYRETVPTRRYHQTEELAQWEQRMADNKRALPPHPNIVAMYHVFADWIPSLPGSSKLYPDALPSRINPDGSGRNMSLFLLMKRYDMTLKQYMLNREINIRESILLLAQLLEGVCHMNLYGIAHRDLKSDNILLDLSEKSDNCPSLVITDFGCCLADKHHGLYLPFNSHDVDKGGNTLLMAPEVVIAEPGPFTSINYTKSDLWTVGTIAYEIFGMNNPFYGSNNEKSTLKNHNYADHELPNLPENVPPVVAALIKNILSRNMYKRLNTEMAATVMQLYLWVPSTWLLQTSKIPSSNEILQWLLCLTTKVLCEGREFKVLTSDLSDTENKKIEPNAYRRTLSTRSCGRRTMPEYQLIASFLKRVSLVNVKEGLLWIHKNTPIPNV